MRDAVKMTLLPSAIALGVLVLAHRPLLVMLYDADVQASDAAAGLYFAGSLLRIAAWIPLIALYAMRRTREIATGELLSLPLFAALSIAAGKHLSLEMAGVFWLLSYLAYVAYNFHAVHRHRQESPAAKRLR